ncbi:Adenylate cyclase [Chitinispirillum alkaliphilum]|nr:Adenylate cyclase [Chitinispirillum alkaliphilum]
MRFSEAAFKILFSKDFYITQKFIFVAGVIVPLFSIVFYFTCQLQGLWESLPLRVVSALLALPFLFFPRKDPLKWFHRKYYDFVFFLILPVFFTFMYLMNSSSTYWFVSFMWAGIFYGLFASRAFLPLVLFPLGYMSAIIMYVGYYGNAPNIIRESFGVFTIAWFSSILLGLIKLTINVFYLLSLEAESIRVKAAESERNRYILECKNNELITRNMIISTFVRPSILSEIDNGKDPRNFSPRTVEKTILICDMRDFTPQTSAMDDAENQAQFINKYFEMMINPVFEFDGEVDKLMGDAVMAVFPDGDKAVSAGVEMRKRLQIYNKQLFFAGMKKINNVISISKGTMLEANIGGLQKLDRTYIGAAVNICSRLEHIAKYYGLEIIITEEIVEALGEKSECRLIDIIKVKGYNKKIEIYEVYSHNPRKVIDYKNSIKEKFQYGIHLYFKNHIQRAGAIFKEILEEMPEHTYKKGKLMDSIVQYYAAHCIKQLNLADSMGESFNADEGCHNFSADQIRRDWEKIPKEKIIAQLG